LIYLLIAYGAAVLLIGGYCLHAWLDLRSARQRLAEAGEQVGQ
jgi:hypothetical protein